MKKNYLNKIRARTSPEIKAYVSKSFDVSDRIYELMQEKGLNQKELAKKMGKLSPENSAHAFDSFKISSNSAPDSDPIELLFLSLLSRSKYFDTNT